MKKLSIILVAVLLCIVFIAEQALATNKYTRYRRSRKPAAASVKESKETPVSPRRQSVDYERILSQNEDPLIEDHLWYYRGVKYLNGGKPSEAEGLFRRILTIHPESVWANGARLKLAEALIDLGRYDEADRIISEYLKGKPNRFDAFDAKLIRGRALLESGSSSAVSHFKFLAQSAAEEAELEEVQAYFGKLNRRFGVNMHSWFRRPDVQYRVAESFFDASQWDEAANRVRRHVLPAHPSPELRRQAEFLLARALSRTHNYREAVDILEKLRRSGGNYPGLSYWLARTYTKMDEYEKAIAIRREMVKRYGRSRSAADYLSKIAFLHLDQGKYKKSKKEWAEVIAMRPRGRNLMFAKWYYAWCNYRLGNYAEAIKTFDWMLAHGAKRYKFRDRVKYWKARALTESGKVGEGRSLLRQIAVRRGYYGVLARRRLNGDKRTFKTFARGRSGGHSSHVSKPRLPSPSAVRGQSVHLARAILLDDLGLRELAAKEVRAAENDAGADSMILLELARRNNAHDVGRRVAVRRFYPVLNGSPSSGHARYIWEQAYPEAYEPIVRSKVSGSPVDENLVWAIMKAESNFRPEVVSAVGAIGLMQLMPSTARRLSRNTDSRRLFEPETNIEFGTRYIKENLWPLFPDDYVSVIASYNAGEEAVARWLKNKPLREDIELFIEEIPYKETNLYVRRVLSNYWAMQRLYD